MRELWKDFLFKYYKLHVDLLVFGRAGPAQVADDGEGDTASTHS